MDFRGRSGRKEFWLWLLAVFLGVFLVALIEKFLRLAGPGESSWLTWAYMMASIVPTLSASFRRLHDVNRSGLWNFLPMATLFVTSAISTGISRLWGEQAAAIPITISAFLLIGSSIYVTVLCIRRGDQDPNRFGPPPSRTNRFTTVSRAANKVSPPKKRKKFNLKTKT